MKIILATALAIVLTWSQRAEACGCFAPPSPAEPIVQAGERILFSVKDGIVTAHIQIQYAGEAKDFGWLLPLPSVPTLKVGSDELFERLEAATRPQYAAQVVGQCPRPFTFGCAKTSVLLSESGRAEPEGSPLVKSASVGPYDYAVLKADDKAAMFTWLADNRYFVPAGTDGAVGPYIRPGGYFLALKLKAGARTGDVTPVILEYPAELPMIPLILTSVGATPNMGVQVYLLGNGRGIPRNFHHVVINDALLGWLNGGQNYADLVTKAVSEAPQKHGFVTEYAATSSVMKDQLAPAGRFGTEAELAATATPAAFVATLVLNGFPAVADGSRLPTPVLGHILKQIPYPPRLAARDIDEATFIGDVGYYLSDSYRAQNADAFDGYTFAFDAPSLAHEIFEQYVTPMRETQAMFAEFPTLTRLFTTLSPEDMTEDPVFSFNPSLPEVSNKHGGSMVPNCPAQDLITEQRWVIEKTFNGSAPPESGSTPAALRIEVLAEEGLPTVVTDNHDRIHERFNIDTDPGTPGLQGNGCSTVDPMIVGLLGLMWMRRRRSA